MGIYFGPSKKAIKLGMNYAIFLQKGLGHLAFHQKRACRKLLLQ